MKLLLLPLSFFAVAVSSQAQRPSDIPLALPCSSPQQGSSYQLPIGNPGASTFSLFYLDPMTCAEIPAGQIPISGTQYIQSFLGRSWLARDPNGQVINTFQATDVNLNWYITQTIFPSTQSLTPTSISNQQQSQSQTPESSGTQQPIDSPQKSPQPQLFGGAIAGIVIAIIAALLLFIVLIFFLKKKKSQGNLVGKERRVIRPHYGVLDDELTVKKGDMICIHAAYDDGWMNASIVGTMSKGMVPIGCLSSNDVK